MAKKITPGQRLYLTADGKRLVAEGDPKAATLWCNQYQSVNADEYKRLKGPKPKEDKERKKGEDKGQDNGGDS